MNRLGVVALVGITLLAASSCSRKHLVRTTPSASGATSSGAVSGAATENAAAPDSSCPPMPQKAAIQHGIEKALLQIYGADEGAQKVVVVRLASTDCQHASVTYRLASPGSSPQTGALTEADDGSWSVTLYKKQYRL